MNLGQHIDLFVFLVQEIFQVTDLCLQCSNSLFEAFRITSGKGPPAELIAGAAFEANIGTLRTGWPDAIASYLLASAAVAGLGDAALRTAAHLNYFHW